MMMMMTTTTTTTTTMVLLLLMMMMMCVCDYRMKLPAITVILLASIVVVSDSFIMIDDDSLHPKATNVKNSVLRQYGLTVRTKVSTSTLALCTKTRSSCFWLNLSNNVQLIS